MPSLPRSAQLEVLDAALASAEAGAGRLVLLGGEAGSGKSTVLRLFADREARDHEVLVGLCEPLATPRPGGPLLDLAPRLDPELAARLADGHRTGLLDATLAALTAGERPRVVAFEDIHWADAFTLDLLGFLARRVDAHRLLLVATYRDDEVGSDHATRAWLGDVAAYPGVVRLTVPPLTIAEVATLAGDPDVDAVAVRTLTSGNAFFVGEVLASRGTTLPARVQDAVIARVSRLHPAARDALAAAAVIGTRAEPHLLLAMPRVRATAVDECVSGGFLRFEPPSFEFRHEIVRQAVLAALGPATLREIHADALALLSDHVEADLLPRLAEHADHAGRGPDVLRYAPAAAERAARLGSHREAARQLARAVTHADTEPPERRAELLESWSLELALTGEVGAAIAPRERALALRRELGDLVGASRDLRQLSRLYHTDGRPWPAAEAGQEAAALLAGSGPSPAYGMALSQRSGLAMVAGQYADAIAFGRQALAIADECGDVETRIHALNNVGFSLMWTGDPSGEALCVESLSLALEHGYEDHAARAFQNLSCLGVDRARHDLADLYQSEGLAYCRAHDLDLNGVCLESDRLLYLLDRGDWGAVESDARALLARIDISATHRFIAVLPMLRSFIRTGRPHADLMAEADHLAHGLGAPMQHQLSAARTEAAWLSGTLESLLPELRAAVHADSEDRWATAELAVWVRRADPSFVVPSDLDGPHAVELTATPAVAAAHWRSLGRPYDAALALLAGGEPELRDALSGLHALGATPAARLARARLRALGVTHIERGPRPTTATNPYGLTTREAEVWRLVADGLTNAQIAAGLVLSERTVHHHVSAVLGKLAVRTRAAAAALARSGQSGTPTWAVATDPVGAPVP